MAAPERKIDLEASWLAHLAPEFDKPYMRDLRAFLAAEKRAGKRIFPRGAEFFNAFAHTPLENVKVVILGQDPYHGEGQAHGLSFSVRPGTPIPPSLRNIYKEMSTDLNITPPDHGFLESWAKQGVLLLNAVLTVEQGKAASHQNKGWETFTDQAIEALNEHRSHIVFILWGSYAQKKGAKIDQNKHLVITSPHPSPLSAHRGFFGTRPFSQANRYLVSHQIKPVNWDLNALPS